MPSGLGDGSDMVIKRRFLIFVVGLVFVVALLLMISGVKDYSAWRFLAGQTIGVEFSQAIVTNPPVTIRYRSEKEQVWHLFATNRLALHAGGYFFRFSRADYEDCVLEMRLGLNRLTNVVVDLPTSWKERLPLARLRFARRALIANDWHILGDVLFSEKKAGAFEYLPNVLAWQVILDIWSDRERVRTELEEWRSAEMTIDKLPATLRWLASLKPLAKLDPPLAISWKRVADVVWEYLASLVLAPDRDWLELVAILDLPSTAIVFGERLDDLRGTLDEALAGGDGGFLFFRVGLLQWNGLLTADGGQQPDEEPPIRLQQNEEDMDITRGLESENI